MRKTIKHNNIMNYKDKGRQYIEIVCRGCTIRGRENIWIGFNSSISNQLDKEDDNSYLIFEEDPYNEHDPNAIIVLCRGEFFGTAGYVGKEFTGMVKELLENCKEYRIEMVDESEIGKQEVHLNVFWN